MRNAIADALPLSLFNCIHAIMAADYETATRIAEQERGQPWAGDLLTRAVMLGGRDPARALALVERAIAGKTGQTANAEFLAFAAVENMRAGDFQRGARLLTIANDVDGIACTVPKWQGEPLNGKVVLMACGSPLVRTTQGGVGDEILWARFAPLLARLGARVYLKCHRDLRRLFQSLSGVQVTSDDQIPERPDYIVKAASVPGWIGATRETIPPAPYLYSKPMALSGDSVKIGLSWGCGNAGPQNRYCSLAEMSALALPGAQLFGLDKTRHAEQMRPAPAGMSVIDLTPAFHDFADTASAIMAMDAIVSTDNVIANLAGALGKPLFVLHSFNLPEFRWGEGDRTPWYRSARVFRQPKPGDWRGAVARIVNELRPLTLKRRLAA